MDTAMTILEGVCPDCGADTDIVRIAGTADFMENVTFTAPNAVRETWERGVTEQGMVEVRCADGHVNTAYLTFGCDWTA